MNKYICNFKITNKDSTISEEGLQKNLPEWQIYIGFIVKISQWELTTLSGDYYGQCQYLLEGLMR